MSQEDLSNCFPGAFLSNVKGDKPLETRSQKQVLLEYPEDAVSVKPVQSNANKIKALFMLELPFSFSQKDIMQARCSLFKNNNKEIAVDMLVEQSPHMDIKSCEYFGVYKNIPRYAHSEKNRMNVVQEWVNSSVYKNTIRARQLFADTVLKPFMVQRHNNGIPVILSAEDFFKEISLEDILQFIRSNDVRSILEPISKEYQEITHILIWLVRCDINQISEEGDNESEKVIEKVTVNFLRKNKIKEIEDIPKFKENPEPFLVQLLRIALETGDLGCYKNVLQILQQKYWIDKGISPPELTQELTALHPIASILKLIEDLLINSTKTTYISYANSFYKFLLDGLAKPQSNVIVNVNHVSLFEIEKLFAHLEEKALKSKSIGEFEDLLICRVLFYIPIPTNKLFELGSINDLLNLGYRVPDSFIKLVEAFGKQRQLMFKKFDDHTFGKKVKRLGEYAGIEIKSKDANLTPKVLKKALRAICQKELLVDEEVMRVLPSR